MIGAGVRSGVFLKMFGLCVLAGVLVAGMLLPVTVGGGTTVNEASAAMASMSNSLAKREMPEMSTVTDKDGQPIAYLYNQGSYRVETPANQIPNTMKSAVTAVEDKRFWDHGGVDVEGTMRALAKNVTSGGATQGASTITQQYVKNYLSHVAAHNKMEAQKAKETTVPRKLREAKLATELDRTMSKDEILAGYLNVVPFGNQTFGIGAAAHTYFNKTPQQLTVSESALLAAIVNQPGNLNPNTHPKQALDRRNLVIDLMSDPRNNIRITKKDAEEAKKQPLGVQDPLNRPPNGCVGVGDTATDGFFCSYVKDYLAKSGLDASKLNTGGYTIRTTMDRKATEASKQAAQRQVPGQTPGIANAMAAVEPGSDKHRVRALVANRDFGNDLSKGQTAYDIVSKVQPFGAGSIYKIFPTTAALEQGMSIFDPVNVPPSYTSNVFKNGTKPYTVTNVEGEQTGTMPLQHALATSPNTAFIPLEEKVGLNKTVDMAWKMGMRQSMRGVNTSGSPLNKKGTNGPSVADAVKNGNQGAFTLGFTPTSVLELSNTAATIMSGGKYCPPNPIEEVRDRHGNVVPIKQAPCEQVVPPKVAAELAQGLSKDDTEGTSKESAAQTGWNRPVMAKTGTTQEQKSAAFLGATPQMAGAVLTYSDGNRPQGICDGGGDAPPHLCGHGNIYGGKVPAKTWFEAMNQILAGQPPAPLPTP